MDHQAVKRYVRELLSFLMLMMLDIPDALPLILERSGRRTELQIPMMLALLFTRRGLWRRSDGYRKVSMTATTLLGKLIVT